MSTASNRSMTHRTTPRNRAAAPSVPRPGRIGRASDLLGDLLACYALPVDVARLVAEARYEIEAAIDDADAVVGRPMTRAKALRVAESVGA